MKPHKRLMASLKRIAANAPLYRRSVFETWLKKQPGNVRRAPVWEQQRQFEAAMIVTTEQHR